MAPLRLITALVFVAGCYPPPPAYETFPEPITVSGPPSGEIDPEWMQEQYASNPGEYGYVEPSADPNSEGYVMGTATDQEIDVTLEAYGEWVELDGYGRVWRPDATVVGVDFTPYESCGTWVWTDWGWTFACDWDWGWLPFHYGRWGWFDDYWAWQPGYEWSPGWVEWRGGGGYVGWRPLQPTIRDHRGEHIGPRVRDHRTGTAANIRDHRGEHTGPSVRDHRTGTPPKVRDHRTGGKHRVASTFDSQWRFSAETDFGKRIRPNLFKVPAEGLRLTSSVTRPPVRPTVQPVRAASIMRGRLAVGASIGVRGPRPTASPGAAPGGRHQPAYGGRDRAPSYGGRDRGFDQGRIGSPDRASIYQPTAPVGGGTYAPSGAVHPGHATPPTFDPPDRAVTPPSRHAPVVDHPGRPDRAPDRTSRPPLPPRGSWERTSRPSIDAPTRAPGNWSPPPRPSSGSYGQPSRPSSGSYSPPSRPSSSSGSYSPPSRSSSSSSSSSSSGSWSPPSRSSSSSSSHSSGSSRSSGSSSHSSGSSGSSRSSGGGGGGGGGSRSHRR